MNRLACYIIVLITCGSCDAQNPDSKRAWHWYFGTNAGVDFSSGTAVADTNGIMVAFEGGSSISDTAGNLLFYTDGRSVWNRIHQVMLNGTGLMAGTASSSTQAALIVPKPLSQNIYYIFTTDYIPGTNGMRYSEVDMNLDGGNGGITSNKNILLFAPCTEKQAAVNHCNDESVWVMGHETNNNNYLAYLVTSNGINMNAVISSIGTPMTGNQLAGQIKFSPNGEMLASAINNPLKWLEIYKFDNETGIVSNSILISDTAISQLNFAVSFSPDNTKLYSGLINLYQYEVSNYDSSAIVNSRTTVGSGPGFTSRVLQNAPDGKIYINHSVTTADDSLSVINNPNASGSLCDFHYKGLSLGGRIAVAGLCELNESYFRQTQSIGCATGISEYENNITIYPNPFTNLITFEINSSTTASLNLYDITSRNIFSHTFINSISVNTFNFSSGIYLYELRNKNGLIKKGKIVKD